jgi:checkpoint serine/threonine-protein kinase
VNSKTGKAERVFVNLEAVYPNPADHSEEMSFDELRATYRGWANKNWRKESMRTLRAISGNAQSSPPSLTNAAIEKISKDLEKKVSLDGNESSQQSTPAGNSQGPSQEVKPTKQKKMKMREIKQETQTGKSFQTSDIWQLMFASENKPGLSHWS